MAEEGKKQFDRPSKLLLLLNKYNKYLSAIIVIFTLILGHFVLLQPKISLIQSTRGILVPEVQRKEAELKELIKDLEELNVKFASIKKDRSVDLNKLYKIIPNGQDIADIFLIIDRLSNKHGFQLLSLDVAEPSEKTINKDKNRKKKEEERKKKESLESLILHVVVAQADKEEGYEKFKEYLDGLENSLRLMDIQTVNFEGFTEEAEIFPTFSFSILTYFNNLTEIQEDE